MYNPNLFIVGFQKCGSSTLFNLLCQHPHIIGTEPKETFALTDVHYEHYNSQNSISNPVFSWSLYLKESKDAKYYLEGSVCNFYQKSALDYIAQLPQKKVLFIIRNPVDRFFSTYHYFGNNGLYLKPGTSVTEFFDLLKNSCIETSKEGLRNALEHGRYVKYIDKWRQHIGAENIKVISFHSLLKNPLENINEIFQFLNIDPVKMVTLTQENKTMGVRFPAINRALVKAFRGNGLGESALGKVYKKVLQKKVEKIVDPELVEKLQREYKNEFEVYGELF